MQETATSALVEHIAEQLPALSADELRTIQDFVDYLLWKRQRSPAPAQSVKKSAEALALERMGDSDDPTKWITVVEEGEEIDENALNEWLKARGYKE